MVRARSGESFLNGDGGESFAGCAANTQANDEVDSPQAASKVRPKHAPRFSHGYVLVPYATLDRCIVTARLWSRKALPLGALQGTMVPGVAHHGVVIHERLNVQALNTISQSACFSSRWDAIL